MTRGDALLATLAVFALVTACRRDDHPRPAPPSSAAPVASSPAAAAPTADPDTIERLRALGYASFAPAADGKGSGVVKREVPASWPGFNLFTSPLQCSATLMDEDGAVQNHWQLSPCGRWAQAEMLASGDLIVLGVEPGAASDEDLASRRYIMKLAWDGRRLWKRALPTHHDVAVMPSGLLTLTVKARAIPTVDRKLPVRDNLVAVLSPEGREQTSVSLYDAWTATPDAPPLQPVQPSQRHDVDLLHANSVEWLPDPPAGDEGVFSRGDVLVAVRHQDAVVVLDPAARRLKWVWGRGELSGPHDARLLPSGHILLFDNGLYRGWSRVVEVDPRTKRIVWQYRPAVPSELFTMSRGSSQRLPNGNTLVAESDRGHAFEVTREGRIVWDFWNPFHNEKGQRGVIVRMRRIDRDAVAAIVRERGPGRHPPPSAVTAGSRANGGSASSPR